jgi:ABC-type glycerol-3-phosphate transport system substrate-binding protein
MHTNFRWIFLLLVILSLSFGAVAAQEPVVLDLWIFEGEGEFLPMVIAAFQAEYPHITIQLTDIPESEYVTKIDTALLAGEVPDLGYIYERRWVVAGNFLPLNDEIAAQNINIDDYNVGAISQSCLVDGEVYCIGTYTGAVLLFYNKDMLDAAGIPYPSPSEPMTIDEYAELAAKLSVPNDDLAQRIWGSNISPTYWWMDARNFFSEDGRVAEGYFNDEATAHTHQVIADMITQGSAISASDAAQFTGVDLISTGQLATAIIDNVIAIEQLETAGVRWGAAVVPVEKAGDEPWAYSAAAILLKKPNCSPYFWEPPAINCGWRPQAICR